MRCHAPQEEIDRRRPFNRRPKNGETVSENQNGNLLPVLCDKYPRRICEPNLSISHRNFCETLAQADSPPSSPDGSTDGGGWMSEVLAVNTLSKTEEQEIKFGTFCVERGGEIID